MQNNSNSYDVIIVGGGFAGLSAAQWLGRYRRKVAVISNGPSRNNVAQHLHGYPGYDGSNPRNLLETLQEEAKRYGATLIEDYVSDIQERSNAFVTLTDKATFFSKKILLATGTKDTLPNLPNFDTFYGKSAWHCPACDAYEYRNKPLAIIGWGPQIIGYTENFLHYTSDITLLTHGHGLKNSAQDVLALREKNIAVYDEPIVALNGKKGQLHSINLENGKEIGCQGLFFSIEHKPRLELAINLGCKIIDNAIVINRQQETTIPGVYAAGDIAPLEELLVVAAATGTVAASNIHKSLN